MIQKRLHLIKTMIYSLLFILIMIIDQRTLTATNYVRTAFVQGSIIPFFIIMMMQMKPSQIKNKFYLLYLIFSCTVLGAGIFYIYQNMEFYLKYSVALVEVLLFGFILMYAIRNFDSYINKKALCRWESILWIAILFLMGISKYNGAWTWIVLAVFPVMISLRMEEQEKKMIFHGMLYGIMASYFLIQGYAFIFRPFDTLRYYGSYNNPNRNALFYTVVMTAYLINTFRLREIQDKKWKQIFNMFILSSIVGFTILTGCKTAILTEIGVLILYAIINVFRKGKKLLKILIRTLLFLLTTILLLPICYLSARYLPPVFHHSVWFYEEYSVDKVHSFDPYNSEKYPKTSEIYNYTLMRWIGISNILATSEVDESLNEESLQIENNNISQMEEKIGEGTNLQDDSDSLVAVLTGEESKGLGTYSARIFIWKEYIKRFNLFGHVKIAALAHNVFIEFIYYFGIIIGTFFFIGYVISVLYQFILSYQSRKFTQFGILSFLVIFGMYGMAEVDWYPGQATLSIFFFMICFMVYMKGDKGDLLNKGEKKIENKNS